MIQSDKKLIIIVVIGCILMALLGFAWKQRTSIPFVTVTLEGITTPFSYGSARLLEDLSRYHYKGLRYLDKYFHH